MTHTDDLDDPLAELFNAAAAGTSVPSVPRKEPPATYEPREFTERCPKCINGFWRGNPRFPCFKCGGKGKVSYKTSAADRAAKRASVAKVKAEKFEAFIQQHQDIFDWLNTEARRNTERNGSFTFPGDILVKFAKYGSLTDGQLDACRRLMARGEAKQAEAKARVENAPAIEVAEIEAAFERARNYKRLPNQIGVKRLTLRLDTFIFKPASKHPGVIYVTDKEERDDEGQPLYLGKIVNGRFQASRACGDERAARVIAAAADPAKAAKAYGQRFGACCVCGRELTAEESITRFMGPVCAERFGF